MLFEFAYFKVFQVINNPCIINPYYFNKMSLSQRSKSLPVSATRKLTPYAVIAKENGAKVFHLNIGDPDLATPNEILDVLHQWPTGPIRYTNSVGEKALIDSLLDYYNKLGFGFLKKQDLVITNGCSEALSMFFFCSCSPGDEVLVFEPYYTNYATIAYINGVVLKAVPTKIEDGFHLPQKAIIEKYITPKTKAILYCNPGNPTGTVYTRQEIESLVNLAIEYNLLLAADEVYREFNFSETPHTSILEFMEKSPKNLILLDGISKRYSLCGARVGNIISLDNELIATITKLAQIRLSGDMLGQISGAALSKVPDQYHIDLKKEYKARRDMIFTGLKKIPGVTVTLPEGAFYVIAGLPVQNAEKFCIWMLEKFRDNNETVMFAPAAGFYQTKGCGQNEIRIAYVLNQSALSRCLEILEKALSEYQE